MFAGGAYLARCNELSQHGRQGRLKGRDFLLGRRPTLQSGPCRVRASPAKTQRTRSEGCPNEVASICDRNPIGPPRLAAREAADVERAI